MKTVNLKIPDLGTASSNAQDNLKKVLDFYDKRRLKYGYLPFFMSGELHIVTSERSGYEKASGWSDHGMYVFGHIFRDLIEPEPELEAKEKNEDHKKINEDFALKVLATVTGNFNLFK